MIKADCHSSLVVVSIYVESQYWQLWRMMNTRKLWVICNWLSLMYNLGDLMPKLSPELLSLHPYVWHKSRCGESNAISPVRHCRGRTSRERRTWNGPCGKLPGASAFIFQPSPRQYKLGPSREEFLVLDEDGSVWEGEVVVVEKICHPHLTFPECSPVCTAAGRMLESWRSGLLNKNSRVGSWEEGFCPNELPNNHCRDIWYDRVCSKYVWDSTLHFTFECIIDLIGLYQWPSQFGDNVIDRYYTHYLFCFILGR